MLSISIFFLFKSGWRIFRYTLQNFQQSPYVFSIMREAILNNILLIKDTHRSGYGNILKLDNLLSVHISEMKLQRVGLYEQPSQVGPRKDPPQWS